MPPPTRTPQQLALRNYAILAGCFIALNAAFFALSDWYYGSEDDGIWQSRGEWLGFTLTLFVVAKAAQLKPREIGHGLAATLGITLFGLGFAAMKHGMTPVLCATLLILGMLLPVLAYYAWFGSRAAWSFLISICAVVGLCLFFGAPKVRGQLGIGLWTAMIFPGLFVIATVALIAIRRQFGANPSTRTFAAE